MIVGGVLLKNTAEDATQGLCIPKQCVAGNWAGDCPQATFDFAKAEGTLAGGGEDQGRHV